MLKNSNDTNSDVSKVSMNKKHLIDRLVRLQKKRGVSKAAVSEIVQSIFDHMTMTICKKKKFSYPGFGKFLIRKRKKRMGRNPKTGESVKIPSRKTILFRPFKEAKSDINSKKTT